jgi:uncharacterized secreted protein with C-terminal beta-propeller domain
MITRSETRAAVRAATRNVIERLEARQLLSAAEEVSVRYDDGVLFVDGTDGDDAITVRLDPNDGSVLRVRVDGEVVSTFDVDEVDEVRVSGWAGDDTILIAVPVAAGIGAFVAGGDGDDSIKGGGADDTLRGESGHDTLAGGAGNDDLRGGGGDDWLDGRGGDDELAGGAGEDQMDGDAGDDEIAGGGDDDWIDGGSGDDDLQAGSGDDEIVGGGGDDKVRGSGGDDSLAGGTGEDTLAGDGGDDEITGGTEDDVVRGNEGKDTLWGGDGADTIAGGGDDDELNIERGVDQTKGAKYDTINNDKYRNPLKRLDDEAGLKAWLIDQAVKQWRGYLGNGVWQRYGYYCDCVFLRPATGPAVLNDVVAGSAAIDYSTTNVQEQGVDEADLVKTDGEYLYLVSDAELVIVDAWPASEMHVVSRTPIAGNLSGIYLKGDTLAVVSNTYESNVPEDGEGDAAPVKRHWYGWSTPQTKVTVLDVSDRADPEIIEETTLDGAHTDTRMIGGRLYVVLNNWRNMPEPLVIDETPEEPGEPAEVPGDAAESRLAHDLFWEGPATDVRYETEAEYRARLEAMSLEELLPDYETTAGGETIRGDLADLSNFYVPGGEDEDDYHNNMFSVVMFDVTDDEAGVKTVTSVAGLNGQVYASTDSLYVTATSWDKPISSWWWSGDRQTDIYKFGLGASEVKLGGSGQVPGWIINQFALDEEEGILRIATTSDTASGRSNNVFTLADAGKDLEIVGGITDLAFSERIYSVRFVGDRGYLVTFRQTDPLFTIDLSDPANPEVKGILKIPGYSSYLHPIADDLVIGVGRDATETGQVRGVQVSLFDVSDMENPKRLHTRTFGSQGDWSWNSWTAAEWDHHAFSYFPEQKVLALPMMTGGYSWHDGDAGPKFGLHVLKVDREEGFTSLGTVEHSDQAPLRSLRIGDALYSIGYDAIRVVDLADPGNVLKVLDAVIRPDYGYYYGGPWIIGRPIMLIDVV